MFYNRKFMHINW